MSIFPFFFSTIVMSFVRELLDINIKKKMSEEVKDFEANVSNIFSLDLNMGGTQEDRTACKSTCTCIQTYHLCLDTSW